MWFWIAKIKQQHIKLSDISLEYDALLDVDFAAVMSELYIKTEISYTKVTSIHYQTLSKKDINWKIAVKNLSTESLQALLLLFLDKCDNLWKWKWKKLQSHHQ